MTASLSHALTAWLLFAGKKNGVPFLARHRWRDALLGSLVIAGIVTFAFVYGAPRTHAIFPVAPRSVVLNRSVDVRRMHAQDRELCHYR